MLIQNAELLLLSTVYSETKAHAEEVASLKYLQVIFPFPPMSD